MNRHLKGLKAFGGKYPKSRRIIVSLDMFNRRMGETECVYVHDSLKRSEGVWFHWIKQL